MPTEPHSFRRLVLGLQPRAPDATVELAVDLAELLQLELLGLFLEDTSLQHLAQIPFAREIRPLGGGWHPLDIDRLSLDVELAARAIERAFTSAAKRLATGYQFEIARGPLAETLVSLSRSSDIVMIVEPTSPAERATQQFAWLMQAAFRSAAAVLIVPPRMARSKGPVAVLATGADDPSIRAGAAIALAAKEPLIVVDIGKTAIDEARIAALAAETGLAVRHIVVDEAARTRPAEALANLQERLVVVARGVVTDEAASALASARGAPILFIESPVTATAPAAA